MAKRQMAREANAKKLHDAQTGRRGTGLGPSQMDQAQIKQRGAIASQAATAGSQEAQIAQAQQTSPEPPQAPEGTTIPNPAQKGVLSYDRKLWMRR